MSTDILLILHFIGLALGVGTGFANMRLGMAVQDMEPAERTKFMLRAMALAKNGSLGLALLLVSGIGLMFTKYGGIRETFAVAGGAFHAKLTLVVALMGLLGWMQVHAKRAREAQGGPSMAKLPMIGKIMLPVAVLTVVCAVLAFH